MAQKEAKARIKINNLLQPAGWRFFDNEDGKANIVLESNVKLTEKSINELGEDFEKHRNGFVDFLLLDNRGYPLVVLEAKSEDKNPLDGKEQARRYAKSLSVRYIILSNGNLHYFWDLERGNPNVITSFPTPDSLQDLSIYKPNPEQLVNEIIDKDYVVLTQKPDYVHDPRWNNEAERAEFIRDNDLKFLRPYQIKAVKAIQEAVRTGNDRFLFEMATGTGKTLVAGAIIKLFLRTANAKRVLFLVDRLELEDQAWKSFTKFLKNDYKSVIYKENRDDWHKAEIVVTTVQSLLFNNKYKRLFSPTDFDLLISDEAHRSIGGNSRAVFEYFVGYKLGLTATPKDYLKKIDAKKLNDKDPRALERRMLLDTYRTFGCESGNPTFRYSLIDGVKDGYLVNPVVVDARTEITTQLLSDEGYSVLVPAESDGEGNNEEELSFFQRDFEKTFFSEETNKIFCKTFIENALKDPISGEIGKTIVFCVSQNHASKITQVLNEFADRLYPGNYNSDFAVQVTSNIQNAQQFTINFTNNNLNEHSRFLDGYKTSKTRVCVTVGMMTTGYDCQDILNLCLMRPIFSPTDFIQIKGRGTRKFVFGYAVKDEFGRLEEVKVDKGNFKLFDFFANCEYFEEKFNYDEVLKLPPVSSKKGNGEGKQVYRDDYENIDIDPLKTMTEMAVGENGMRVDWMFYEKFENTVKNDTLARDIYENGGLDEVEKYIREKLFDKPEEYFNLEKLRKAIKVDRRVGLKEIIEKIFGRIKTFKTKNELLEEEFEKFVSIYKPESKDVLAIKNVMKEYILNPRFREIMETGHYANLATFPIRDDFKVLGKEWKTIIPEYVKDYVSLNTYIN